MGSSLVVASGGYSLVAVKGLLIAATSLVEHGLEACGENRRVKKGKSFR